MAIAVPNEIPSEEESEAYKGIVRTREQEQARIARARGMRSQNDYVTHNNPPQRAANENMMAANDNEEEERRGRQEEAQARVQRLRLARAQAVLTAEAEAHDQIEQEKVEIGPYLPAGAVGVLKDLLDFILLGSLPVVGTVVTFFASVIIFILTIFAKKNSSVEDMGFIIKRLLIVLVGFVVEGFVFGVNFFPFETVTVLVIYLMDKYLSQKQVKVLKGVVTGLNKAKL